MAASLKASYEFTKDKKGCTITVCRHYTPKKPICQSVLCVVNKGSFDFSACIAFLLLFRINLLYLDGMKKTKRKIENKKSGTYSGSDMKRYLGALSEIHNENLKAINENFHIINRKLDSHSEMIGSLMEDVAVLKEDVSIIKDDISVIKADLKQKVDYSEFASLAKRVSKLESKSNL